MGQVCERIVKEIIKKAIDKSSLAGAFFYINREKKKQQSRIKKKKES